MIADYGSLNMGQIVSWGNPYHGKVVSNVVTLPNAATRAFTAGGECVLVAINGAPAEMDTNTEADATAGLRWDNYVFLQDPTNLKKLYYPGTSQIIGWTYKDTTGKAWRLAATIVNGPDVGTRYIQVTARRVVTAVTSNIGTVAIPAEPSAMGGALVSLLDILPRPDGVKALFSLRINTLQKLSCVIEVTASGGDDVYAPSIASEVLASGDDVYSYSEVDVYTPQEYVHAIYDDDGWIETATTEIRHYPPGAYYKNITDERIVGMAYDDTGAIQTFHFKYSTWAEQGSTQTITPSEWVLDARDSPYTDTRTIVEHGQDIHHHQVEFWSGAGSYILHTQTGTTWTKTGTAPLELSTFAWTFPYFAPRHAEAQISNSGAVSDYVDVSDSPSKVTIITTLLPLKFSLTTFGLGRDSRTSVQEMSYDDLSPFLTIPAYNGASIAAFGPKSWEYNPIAKPTRPGLSTISVIAHPLSGEFVYGNNTGFV